MSKLDFSNILASTTSKDFQYKIEYGYICFIETKTNENSIYKNKIIYVAPFSVGYHPNNKTIGIVAQMPAFTSHPGIYGGNPVPKIGDKCFYIVHKGSERYFAQILTFTEHSTFSLSGGIDGMPDKSGLIFKSSESSGFLHIDLKPKIQLFNAPKNYLKLHSITGSNSIIEMVTEDFKINFLGGIFNVETNKNTKLDKHTTHFYLSVAKKHDIFLNTSDVGEMQFQDFGILLPQPSMAKFYSDKAVLQMGNIPNGSHVLQLDTRQSINNTPIPDTFTFLRMGYQGQASEVIKFSKPTGGPAQQPSEFGKLIDFGGITSTSMGTPSSAFYFALGGNPTTPIYQLSVASNLTLPTIIGGQVINTDVYDASKLSSTEVSAILYSHKISLQEGNTILFQSPGIYTLQTSKASKHTFAIGPIPGLTLYENSIAPMTGDYELVVNKINKLSITTTGITLSVGPASINLSNTGIKISIGTSSIELFVDGTVQINGINITIGKAADQLVTKRWLESVFSTHIHGTAVGPSTPPLPPAGTPATTNFPFVTFNTMG